LNIKQWPHIIAENFKIKHYVYIKYITSTINTKDEPLTIFGNKKIKL